MKNNGYFATARKRAAFNGLLIYFVVILYLLLFHSSCSHQITIKQPVNYIIDIPEYLQMRLNFAVGDSIYTDRDFSIEQYDSLLNGCYIIKTPNDLKMSSEPISFYYDVPIKLYIAFDLDRSIYFPDWLGNWAYTGKQISASDPGVEAFYIFEREFFPGQIILGGNYSIGTDPHSMYFLFLRELSYQTFNQLDSVYVMCDPAEDDIQYYNLGIELPDIFINNFGYDVEKNFEFLGLPKWGFRYKITQDPGFTNWTISATDTATNTGLFSSERVWLYIDEVSIDTTAPGRPRELIVRDADKARK